LGIRKAINDHPAFSASLGAGLCVLMAVLLLSESGRPGRSSALALYAGKAFYSDDDGESWFIEDLSKVPPFTHDGKPAYRAMLFRCGTGKPFLGYLGKYPDAELKEVAALRAAQAQRDPSRPPNFMPAPGMPMDVKKPGDTQWFPASAGTDAQRTAEYRRMLAPVCPDGSPASAVSPADADAH
jgi:hypothetical protein